MISSIGKKVVEIVFFYTDIESDKHSNNNPYQQNLIYFLVRLKAQYMKHAHMYNECNI
jgi:hypothetical protein